MRAQHQVLFPFILSTLALLISMAACATDEQSRAVPDAAKPQAVAEGVATRALPQAEPRELLRPPVATTTVKIDCPPSVAPFGMPQRPDGWKQGVTNGWLKEAFYINDPGLYRAHCALLVLPGSPELPFHVS